jgi:hypothetical protein
MFRAPRAAALSLAVVLSATLIGAGAAPARATSIPFPPTLNLFVMEGFVYQDPNMAACTSAAAMMMLNLVAYHGTGGEGFRWLPDVSGAKRDQVLDWTQVRDTLRGGYGSDPHGWRNALNFEGYGADALWEGRRVYEDLAYGTFDGAVKSAIRAMIQYYKPVGLLAWAGRHGQVLHGYWGLVGDPFAKDGLGRYTNAFTVDGFYLSDPLQSQAYVNKRVTLRNLAASNNLRLRFGAYREHDSPYDDRYTSGARPAHDEWYGRFVIVAPVR